MNNSMFDRDVAVRLEREGNSFITCRTLSVRARDINLSRKAREIDPELAPSEPNPSASAMIDLTEGNIEFNKKD